MAQLTDDCFAFSGPLMPVTEVERIIVERVSPVAESEIVPLGSAVGRCSTGLTVAATSHGSIPSSRSTGGLA